MTTKDNQVLRKEPQTALGAKMLRVLIASTAVVVFAASPARASEPEWRGEVDAICSETETSMDLDLAVLKQLVLRARVLEPTIARVPGPAGRVYGKRLRMCADLLQFVLESKESGQGESKPPRKD